MVGLHSKGIGQESRGLGKFWKNIHTCLGQDDSGPEFKYSTFSEDGCGESFGPNFGPNFGFDVLTVKAERAASRHPAQPFVPWTKKGWATGEGGPSEVENCWKCLELGKYEQAQEVGF